MNKLEEEWKKYDFDDFQDDQEQIKAQRRLIKSRNAENEKLKKEVKIQNQSLRAHVRARERRMEKNNILHNECIILDDALEEIIKGEGAFNREPLKHAENTIENMKKIAREARGGERCGLTK